MSEFVDADVAAAIAVVIQAEQVLLAAGGGQPAHAASPLVYSQISVKGPPLHAAELGQVRSDLIAPDDVQLRAGHFQIPMHSGLFIHNHRQAAIGLAHGLVGNILVGLDVNAVEIEHLRIEILLRGRERGDGRLDLFQIGKRRFGSFGGLDRGLFTLKRQTDQGHSAFLFSHENSLGLALGVGHHPGVRSLRGLDQRSIGRNVGGRLALAV